MCDLPIDVIPGSSPPRFRWRHKVATPIGEKAIECTGLMLPSIEASLCTLVAIAKERAARIAVLTASVKSQAEQIEALTQQIEGLHKQLIAATDRIGAQSETLSRMAEKTAPVPQTKNKAQR